MIKRNCRILFLILLSYVSHRFVWAYVTHLNNRLEIRSISYFEKVHKTLQIVNKNWWIRCAAHNTFNEHSPMFSMLSQYMNFIAVGKRMFEKKIVSDEWNGMEQRIVYKQRLNNCEIWFCIYRATMCAISNFCHFFLVCKMYGSQKALSLRSIFVNYSNFRL